MWRRILLCFSLCLLCCCCLAGVAMADDVPSESAAPDEDVITAEQFLQELGFDPEDEDAVSAFLTWLYPLEPASEHDMALILSGSEYSGLDAGKVYFLWQYLRNAFDSEELGFSWSTVGTVRPANGVKMGYFGLDSRTGTFYVLTQMPNFNGTTYQDVPYYASFNLSSYMSQQGYLTQADLNLTTIESLLRDVLGNQSSAFSQQYSILSVLQDLRASIGLSGTGSGYTVLENLALLRSLLEGSSDSVLRAVRSWQFDPVSNSLASVAGDGTPYGVAELLDVNFKDLDQLLLKNFGQSFEFGYYYDYDGTYRNLSSGSDLLSVLSAIGSSLRYSSATYHSHLLPDGSSSSLVRAITPMLLADGFLGLNTNLETALVGGHGGSAQYSKLVFDEQLNKSTETADYTDLLHAMVGIGTDIQNPLSQLQAVLAGDSDLELHRNTQENIDSVTDNFTGSGEGAVSSGEISDASGLTSGIGDAFGGNQVSTGDAFMAATDSGNFNFFSQETAVALDSVTYPAAVSLAEDDDWMSDYVADKDGFYTVADKSGWSLLDYLGKEG